MPNHLEDKFGRARDRFMAEWQHETSGASLCARIQRKPHKKRITHDTLQDQEITGLKHELSQLHKLLGMLLVFVDPMDVRAAFELRRITPRADVLRDWAEHSVPPDGLEEVDEEKPW